MLGHTLKLDAEYQFFLILQILVQISKLISKVAVYVHHAINYQYTVAWKTFGSGKLC